MNKLANLLKTAAAALREEFSEKNDALDKVAELEAELDRVQAAKAVTFQLWKLGSFPAEDLEEHFDTFLNKTQDEINTFEKAAHLMGNSNSRISDSMGVGKLSEQTQYYGTPEERFINNLLEE